MGIFRNGLVAAAASFLLGAASAQATPVTFTADPTSSFALSITAGVLGSANGSAVVSGSLTASVTSTATPPITITESGSTFNVANFTITGLALGALAIDNFQFTVSGPAATTTGSNPYTVNLAGATITVDNGQVIQGGSTVLFDYAKTPDVVTLPNPTNSTFQVSGSNLSWTIPTTMTSTLSTLNIPVNITITTDLLLKGSVVPEPTSLALLSAGLTGLAAFGRRRSR
jgi:hypothetical protein